MALQEAQEAFGATASPGRWLDRKLSPWASERLVLVVGAVCAIYAMAALVLTLQGRQAFPLGDFPALWSSGVTAHIGDARINYDADALHLRQVVLGMNPHADNPFPYPPTMLLLLAPLGALPLDVAFYVFMGLSFLAYAAALGLGRDWPWALAAAIAPASAITLISGQTGFLTGALMIGGLRLLPARPLLAGVLFGLMTLKPQLGVLIPVALVAAREGRAFAAAAATAAAAAALSGLAFGFDLWPLWIEALTDYARRFPPVLGYMPTIQANAQMLGAAPALADALQIAVTLAVAWRVWRVWRSGPTAQGAALLVMGTFLATPHAFNYDMPMTTLAIVGYLWPRRRDGFDVGEALAASLALLTPFLLLELKKVGMPVSFGTLGLMFVLLAFPRRRQPEASLPR